MSQSPKKNPLTSSGINKSQLQSDVIYNKIDEQAFMQMLANKKLIYSHCEKRNNTGIMHNQRFLIVYGQEYIGYANKLNKKEKFLPFMNQKDVPQMKSMIPFEDIKGITTQSNSLKIQFSSRDKKSNKVEEKEWVMKMKTPAMAKGWLQKIDLVVRQSVITNTKNQEIQIPMNTYRNEQNVKKGLSPLNSEIINSNKNEQQKLSTPTFSQRRNANNSNLLNGSQKPNNQPINQLKNDKVSNQPIMTTSAMNIVEKSEQDEIDLSQQKILTNTKSQPNITKKGINNQKIEYYEQKNNEQSIKVIPIDKNTTTNIQSKNNEFVYSKKISEGNNPNNSTSREGMNNTSSPSKSNIYIQQNEQEQLAKKYNRKKQEKQQIINLSQIQIRQDNKDMESGKHKIGSQMKGETKRQQLNSQFLLKDQENQQFQDWTYRFLTENEPYVILDFKYYSEELVKNLVDEMFLPKNKRRYNPYSTRSEIWQYYIEKVFVTVAFTSIKMVQVYSKSNKQTLLDESAIKQLNNEFKNMNYLLQVTKNKGKIRVALANLVEYKGVVCLVKSKIYETQNPSEIILDELQHQYAKLQIQSKIKKSIFKDKQGVLETKYLNSQLYQSQSRKENITFEANYFDLVFVDQVKNFLPQDLLYKDKDPVNKQLRPQILRRNNLRLEGKHLYPSAKKNQNYQENEKSIKELQYVTKQILSSIEELLVQWESLETIIISPSEVTGLFHKHGLNLRYLGIVYQNAKLSFVKKICMSEICSRCIKMIFRFQLQQEITRNQFTQKELARLKEDNIPEYIDNFDKNLIGLALEYLNKILGDSVQSRDIWKLVNKQAIENFHTEVSKDNIDQAYFLSCLTYHCGIDVYWNRFTNNSSTPLFKNIEYFTKQMIIGFAIRTKTYDLDFTDLYKSLKDLLQYDSETSKNQIIKLLQIKVNQIPPYFKLDKMYKTLAVLLSNFISPVEHTVQNSQFKHLDIYEIVDEIRPTIQNLNVLLMQIKWAMKIDDANYVNMYFQKTMTILNKWCGQFHIIYSQFYEQFATYYLSKSNYEQAITLTKTSIINLLRYLEKNSLRIADSYYLLGNIYFKSSKKEDAFVNYKKSKMIFEINNKTEEIGYSLICLRISQIYLSQKNPIQCINTLSSSLKIFEEKYLKEGQYQEEMIQGYELLSRSFQILNKEKQRAQIQQLCGRKLKNIRQRGNFVKILKILLVKQFSEVREEDYKTYEMLYENFKNEKNPPELNQIYEYLEKIVALRDFLQSMREYIKNINKIYNLIVTNDIFLIWKGIKAESNDPILQFIGIFESLYHLLGESFMLGAIKYHY